MRKAFVIILALILVLSSFVLAFADVGDDVSEGIKSALTTIKKVVNPIATIAVIGCGIYCIMGSDPQNIKKAKTWAISIFVGLLVINLADKIVAWASLIGK